jgi:hypothetical protein
VNARHNRRVRRPGFHSRLLIVLACLALVSLRVAGLHLHLCFDGSEPPVSLHLVAGDSHHADEPDGITHDDQDLKVADDYLLKKPGSDSDLSLLALCVALLLFFLPRLLALLPRSAPPPAPRALRHFRLPPSRGPPLIA